MSGIEHGIGAGSSPKSGDGGYRKSLRGKKPKKRTRAGLSGGHICLICSALLVGKTERWPNNQYFRPGLTILSSPPVQFQIHTAGRIGTRNLGITFHCHWPMILPSGRQLSNASRPQVRMTHVLLAASACSPGKVPYLGTQSVPTSSLSRINHVYNWHFPRRPYDETSGRGGPRPKPKS